MLILFALIVMRMSGAILINPIFGRTGVPSRVKAAFTLMMSLMLYLSLDGTLEYEPATMIEFIVMLVKELLFGVVISYGMDLAFCVVRFASTIMDHTMGLSMAQVFDPQYGTQTTVTSGLYYTLIVMLFFATDNHLRLIGIFFHSAEQIPFGQIMWNRQLPLAILDMFQNCIYMGLQFAMPIVAMELLAEVSIGILMRIIPQINVFVVNFQVKIIVGLVLMLVLYQPMTEKIYEIMEWMFSSIEVFIPLLH